MRNSKFVLIKSIGCLKEGKVFNSYCGLVRGTTVVVDNDVKYIPFNNKEYFKPKE